MNKKKRVLSLVMALVMALGVLAVMPMTVSAENAFDYSKIASTKTIDYVDVAPKQDGNVENGEYSLQIADANSKQVETVNQYYAHDDAFIYIAVVVPTLKNTSAATFYVFPSQNVQDASYSYRQNEALIFQFFKSNLSGSDTSLKFNPYLYSDREITMGTFSTDTSTYGGTHNATFTNGAATNVTFEIKISKAALAASAGVSVENFTSFRYYFEYTNSERQVWLYGRLTEAEKTAATASASTGGAATVDTANWYWFPKSFNLNYTDIESADVGSVRLSDPSGLRFQTTVSKAYLAELKADGYTVEAGTLIAPKATFESFDVNQTTAPTGTAGVDYLDVVASLEQPYNNGVSTITFAGSIVNIKTAHLDDDFTAIGYLKLTNGNTTEYVYSNKVTKNVSAVAQAAIDSGNYEGTDLTTLQGLVAAAN